MTNNELLKADMLDILFEHRNKSYGAYALRKTYTHRLGIALGVALSIVLLFLSLTFLKNDRAGNGSLKYDRTMILTDVNLEKEKIREPEKPKEIPKPQVAQAAYQKIIVVPDKDASKEIPDMKTVETSDISNVNVEGTQSDGIVKLATQSNGNGDDPVKEQEKIIDADLPSHPPAFPGGTAAWLSFLQRYLQSPQDLEPGQRIEVLVRFWVDEEGNVFRPEIVKSGGGLFDKEVIRVMKKMPRWEPAIQHGKNIAVAFTQPVIFIGVEE